MYAQCLHEDLPRPDRRNITYCIIHAITAYHTIAIKMMIMKKQRTARRRRLSTTVVAATTIALLSVAATISAFAPPPLSERIISTATVSLQSTSSQNPSSSSDEELTIEGYSRCLSPREAKRSVKNESRQYSIIDRKPKWQRPLSLVSKGVKKVITQKPKKPGSLILLRCGESKWTKTGRFTGWGESE